MTKQEARGIARYYAAKGISEMLGYYQDHAFPSALWGKITDHERGKILDAMLEIGRELNERSVHPEQWKKSHPV